MLVSKFRGFFGGEGKLTTSCHHVYAWFTFKTQSTASAPTLVHESSNSFDFLPRQINEKRLFTLTYTKGNYSWHPEVADSGVLTLDKNSYL